MAAAAAVTPLGLLHMRPLQHWLHGRVPRWAWQSGTLRVQVTPACRQTFTPWSDLSFLRAGVPLEQVSRHAVVYTDASAKGWGATFRWPLYSTPSATHTATAYMLIYFRFVVGACSELNLRQANCLSSIFYLKFRFYTQKCVFL